MKYQLLLLSLLAAFSNNVAVESAKEQKIDVIEIADGIKLSCKDGKNVSGNNLESKELELTYRDDNTGEYKCEDGTTIFVKFRTCDNCVELDTASLVGMLVGNLVATIVVGVAVYLIASQGRPGQVKPTKKKSDKQNLIRNEAPGDPSYQPLKYKRGRDEYDVLNRK